MLCASAPAAQAADGLGRRKGMIFGSQQLRIRTRIYAGFGVLVTIAVGIGVFGADRLTRVNAQFHNLGEISGNASHIQDATLQLETTRRAATRYLATSEEDARQTMQRSITEAI